MRAAAAAGLICLAGLLAASAFGQEAGGGLRLPPPTYPAAAARLQAGRAAAALAALERRAAAEGDSTPPLERAVLRAALLAQDGRPVEAESAWRDVIGRAVFLRTYARRALVESAAGRGAPAAAEPVLAELVRGDAARHRDLVLRVAPARLDTGAPGRAAALFETAPTPDDQRAILWRAGVAAVRAGRHERALRNLRGLIERGPGGELALAARYWLGVAHERRGDRAAAARVFEPLAARHPYHYYGLTARRRLAEIRGEPDAPTPLDFPGLTLGAASRGRAEFRAAMTLARAGLIEDAAWYLRRLLDRRRGDRGLALLAARASSRAGDHAAAARVLFNHFPDFFQRPARNLPDDFLTMAYPRPYWDTVAAAARAHGADPVLLVSLMRRESRFDPAARSAVGAVGLLQIMPYTAEALAERAGVGGVLAGGVDDAELAEPRVNVAIAARLNADLLALFDGARLPVIASYNAGEERAGDWWAAARGLRDDFFVDGIPYTETRNFAREVLANYAAYERIYGGP